MAGVGATHASTVVSMRLPITFDNPIPEFIAAVDDIETTANINKLFLFAFGLGSTLEARPQKEYSKLMIVVDTLALITGQTAGQIAWRGVVRALKDEASERKRGNVTAAQTTW